jgi:LPXTG-site transpeptidase (sortase) family protein
MSRGPLLLWIERGLLAIGIALGAWCAATLVEARFFNQLSLKPQNDQPITVTQTLPPGVHPLPGDAHDASAPQPAPAPAQGALLGRIEAPDVQLSAPILEGSDDGTLSHGAGHIEDTPFPGQPGNIGIAGHRDTTFRPVRRMRVGDPINIETAGKVYHYRITKTSIVGPDDVYVLDPTPQPALTLVTCYPFDFVGHAPQRFIVRAALVEETGSPRAPQRTGK